MVETRPIDSITCTERHVRIDARLGEHDTKLDALEKSDVRNTTKIDNLCDKLANLTRAIWVFVSVVFTALVGFFIWFVQQPK
jgi:hypothetical protein